MRPSVWRGAARGMGLALACAGCIQLDGFLYAPEPQPPDANLLAAATDVPADLREEVATDVVASDGVQVNSWLLKHRPDDGTPAARHRTGILYCHGNAHHVGAYALRVQALWRLGYTVLVFDYHGFGKTPGVPTESRLYDDGRAARAYLAGRADLGMAGSRIALYGFSLGAAVCSQLAVDAPTPALILEAPFASVAALVADDSNIDMPHAWFADTRFDTEAKIGAFGGALLVMHGTRDSFIQPAYGQRVWQAARRAAPRVLWRVGDAEHATVPCGLPLAAPLAGGGCAGGFTGAYDDHVTTLLDAALP